MKVLIFTTQFFHLGGAEKLALELAQDLNHRGVHTDVLSMYRDDLPNVQNVTLKLKKNGIPKVHFLGMKINPPIVRIFPAILRLRKLIKQEEYDIIETSLLSPTVITAWAIFGIKIKHIVGIHQVFTRESENFNQHKFLRLSLHKNRGTRFYAVSKCVADAWTQYCGTDPKHIRVIANSVPEHFYSSKAETKEITAELGIVEGARIAIFVGRYAAIKGIDVLLDALGPILESNNIYLLYVGAPDPNLVGTGELLFRMHKKIEALGWDNRISFLNYRQDIARLMASSDILVHPARKEGFGLIIAEAMAVGLPIVASNVEGIPEVLDGTGYIIVPPDDAISLRNAVIETLAAPHEQMAATIKLAKEKAEKFREFKRTKDILDYLKEIAQDTNCS